MSLKLRLIPILSLAVLAAACTTGKKTTVREEINYVSSEKVKTDPKPYMRPVLAARLGMKDDIYTPKRMQPVIAGTISQQPTTQLGYTSAASAVPTPQISTQNFAPYQGAAFDASEQEKICLAKTMFAEARVIDHASLMAVGTVVANRRDSNRFPNTYCGVAAQPGQFTSNPLERNISKADLSYSMQVAEQINQGIRYPGFHGVYYFRTSNTPLPDKDRIQIVGDIGGNTFFKY